MLSATLSVSYGQNATELPQQKQKQQEQRAVAKQQEKVAQHANIEFRGNTAFDEKELRSQLKEQIATIDQYGLTNARADDAAFFLELFYKKHGYAHVDVHYEVRGDRLELDVNEGPLVRLGTIEFSGNNNIAADKLFEYAVGPTRQRYSKLQASLPFVSTDVEEGADLVQRFYVAEGFADCTVEKPQYRFVQPDLVYVLMVVHEGPQYFFGPIEFVGPTIYGAETLRGQLLDLINQPYTDGRVADIPRRLQAYYKARGYYAVKVNASSDIAAAVNGRVPVRIVLDPSHIYYFDGVHVSGTQQLRPSYLVNRFRKLSGQPYSPDVIEKKFRELMRSGLFNILQINPTPIDGNLLRLDINVEEAKPQQFGFSIGYGSFEGAIFGVQYANRNLFGYGRPLTTSIEISERGYKGDILYEDPYLFDSDYSLRARLSALTFDFDGYSKFELGGRLSLGRKITEQYEVSLNYAERHVDITSSTIHPPDLLGPTSYFVSSVGFSQTLDLRKNPLVAPRGFVFDNSIDFASSAIGSDIDFLRTTARASYYVSFAPEPVAVVGGENLEKSALRKWFERSLLAVGARGGVIYPLDDHGTTEALAIPIDERFFNGGSTTVRSFGERELGPHDRGGNPIGGEFYTIFNVEYTFPLYGELKGAVFVDAGNLLPDASQPGFGDMRFGIGAGLRYDLPIGPVRVDYGVNPDPRPGEDFGAFHFSFGFAF
ncbi:MAG: BamA/TamA family outer membrane protein [Verrucomicrobia bacterium]|nr:BamA/TamA family outer membrane protein [Verrucomicrobiota bacterium]